MEVLNDIMNSVSAIHLVYSLLVTRCVLGLGCSPALSVKKSARSSMQHTVSDCFFTW